MPPFRLLTYIVTALIVTYLLLKTFVWREVFGTFDYVLAFLVLTFLLGRVWQRLKQRF